MRLKDLASAITAGKTPIIELHAVDPIIYVAFARDEDILAPLKDEDQQVLKFPSRTAACAALRETGLASVQFVHRCAYDEMIGLSSVEGGAELRQLLTL